MQKTCGLKENKTCHSVTGRLTQGRGPAPAVGPGSEDWARPGFRGLSQTRAPRMSQTPAPAPTPTPAPRQRSAAPCWPRPAPQALFVPSAEKNQTQPFIYLWRFSWCVCGLFGFGFFFFFFFLRFWKVISASFSVLLPLPPLFRPCRASVVGLLDLEGARFAFSPSRFFFQHCGLLRMLSRNMRSCALDKKKKDANPAQLSCKALS